MNAKKIIIIYCTSSHCARVNADRQSSSSGEKKSCAQGHWDSYKKTFPIHINSTFCIDLTILKSNLDVQSCKAVHFKTLEIRVKFF